MGSAAIVWFLVVGGLLMVVAVIQAYVKRLPVTTSMLYLAVGAAIGPWGLGLLKLDAVGRHAVLVEHLSELAVIISLFAAGLKLRMPLADRRWRAPVLLATLSMVLAIAAVAALGVWALGLSLGVAVLLGAILAPTDPVLASDVQVDHPDDSDRLRLMLTSEAGLNDGTAFPFVLLGLGLMGLEGGLAAGHEPHPLGAFGLRWLTVDVLWAITSGLAIGWFAGRGVGRLILYLRRKHQVATGTDDLLCLGLIASSYGLTLAVVGYGFLAVFAAGLSVRRLEVEASGTASADEAERHAQEVVRAAVLDDVPAAGAPVAAGGLRARLEHAAATQPEAAAVFMTGELLRVNENLERLAEIALVVVIGALLTLHTFDFAVLWFVPLLLCVIRPLAVLPVLHALGTTRLPRRLAAWFGIRGIGSVYYLMYGINHGLDEATATRLMNLTLATITVSIVVHGVSVTPLMRWYSRKPEAKASSPGDAAGATAVETRLP
jgi:NhaP-type Na+/H+ or K+/H+ antiporter